MTRKTIFCGALLVACFLVTGCGGSSSRAGFEEALAQARAHWAAQNLRSYTFTVQKVCFCPEEYTRPVTITVREGVATDAPEHLIAYSTVDKVFDVVEAAHASKADRLEVTYSPDGWPQTVFVDPNKLMADEEYGLTITRVAPL